MASTSEARRLIRQGGVRLDGQVVREVERTVALPPPDGGTVLLQAGKRRFARVRAPGGQ